jgi:N utilization substance protein B
LLYQFDFTHDNVDEILKRFWEMHEAQPEPVVELAEKLFRDSLARRAEIDQLIRAHSHHWQMDRMSSVDRNILRVGVCELLAGKELQAPVVINEALEVAKKYSGEDSSKFINGVLDSIHISLKSRLEHKANQATRKKANLEDSE